MSAGVQLMVDKKWLKYTILAKYFSNDSINPPQQTTEDYLQSLSGAPIYTFRSFSCFFKPANNFFWSHFLKLKHFFLLLSHFSPTNKPTESFFKLEHFYLFHWNVRLSESGCECLTTAESTCARTEIMLNMQILLQYEKLFRLVKIWAEERQDLGMKKCQAWIWK